VFGEPLGSNGLSRLLVAAGMCVTEPLPEMFMVQQEVENRIEEATIRTLFMPYLSNVN
jgi:hypothetical protein